MKREIMEAMDELALLRYFPSDPAQRKGVARILARMVGIQTGTTTPQQRLRWLVDTMVNEIGEWKGPVELRGVYCSRFRPDDGVEAECESGPFSPAAVEARMVDHAAQLRGNGPLLLAPPEMTPEQIEQQARGNAALAEAVNRGNERHRINGGRPIRDQDFVRVQSMLDQIERVRP